MAIVKATARKAVGAVLRFYGLLVVAVLALVVIGGALSRNGEHPPAVAPLTSATTSLGPQAIPSIVAVPDVVGTKVVKARHVLSTAGFQIIIDRKVAPQASGKVIAESPISPATIAVGSSVRIVISQGWPSVPNFELSFKGYQLSTAKQLLRRRGFRVGAIVSRYDEFYSLYSPGKVFASRPGGSTEARPGSSVTLLIAKPTPCTPGYSPCLPPHVQGGVLQDYDCGGGTGLGPYYAYTTERVTGEDVYGLDADHNGYGC